MHARREQVAFFVDHDTALYLRELAAEEERTLSGYLRLIIKRHLRSIGERPDDEDDDEEVPGVDAVAV